MVTVKQSVVGGAIAFFVTLAVIIGMRLDEAALTLVVGVACGVGASIPTGLLVFFLMRRRGWANGGRAARGHGLEVDQPPPVVVVAPPALSQLPPLMSWSAGYPQPAGTRREFVIIGEEGIDDGFDFWKE